MNKKGALFTLEVLISILILVVAISVVLSANTSEKTQLNFTTFTNQSNRINSFYFNTPPTTNTGNTTICGDYIKYSNRIISKTIICEGYE